MLKTMFQLRSKLTRAAAPVAKTLYSQAPKRFFSAPVRSGPSYAAMGLFGAGTAGLMYLSYYSYQQRQQMMMQSLQRPQMHLFNPIVQDRIRKTLGFFGAGLFTTGMMVGFFRNSMFALNHPWMLLFGSLGALIGTMATDYERNFPVKLAMWAGFMTLTGLGMVPLIQMASMPIIYDAIMATGFTVGGLGLVAYNAPSEQFLMWGGALGMGLAGLIGLSFASMMWPSPALFNMYMYGGLLLFSAFILYDTQKIIHMAKVQNHYDPINQSLKIYLDTINLFQHFVMIFMNNKRK